MSQKILVFLLLKENGSNRVVETTREEYNMDGTIVSIQNLTKELASFCKNSKS